MAVNKLKVGAVLAAVVAIAAGLLCSPLSRKHPLFHWMIRLEPSLVGMIPALSPDPWGYTLERLERTDLTGQTALVTGANSGIGFEIARALSRQGAAVTMACRDRERCRAAMARIRTEGGHSGAPIFPLIVDLSDLRSVWKSAKTYAGNNQRRIDMLFLNAGIFNDKHELSGGIEKVFATNVVGHHLLYRLLEPALRRSTMARVVSTSSLAGIHWLPPDSPVIPDTREGLNEGPLSPRALYGRSKLAQVMWSQALTRRLGENSTIYVNSAHPGAVYTPMMRRLGVFLKSMLWTPREGALTPLYLGVATDDLREKDLRGRYFHPQAVEFDHPYGKYFELQENVWDLCEELVKRFVTGTSQQRRPPNKDKKN